MTSTQFCIPYKIKISSTKLSVFVVFASNTRFFFRWEDGNNLTSNLFTLITQVSYNTQKYTRHTCMLKVKEQTQDSLVISSLCCADLLILDLVQGRLRAVSYPA